VTSDACEQGTFFGITRESATAIAEAQVLDYFSSVVLFGGSLTPMFEGFILYDRCQTFCQFLLNK
jgi:hypothetical protein